jgi:hypothetical protein
VSWLVKPVLRIDLDRLDLEGRSGLVEILEGHLDRWNLEGILAVRWDLGDRWAHLDLEDHLDLVEILAVRWNLGDRWTH